MMLTELMPFLMEQYVRARNVQDDVKMSFCCDLNRRVHKVLLARLNRLGPE